MIVLDSTNTQLHVICNATPLRASLCILLLTNTRGLASHVWVDDDTSREQTFDPRLKWALVLEFFALGTRNTFSPGWWLQPGLKVPAKRLLCQTEVAGTFSPGCSHQPGLKVYFYSRLVAPTGSNGLLPGRGCAWGWKVTFSPGWSHQPGLKVPPLYPGRLLPPRARAQHILKLTALVFLLPPSLHCSSIHSLIPPSICLISPSILQL